MQDTNILEALHEELKQVNIKIGEAEKRRERGDVEFLYRVLDEKLLFRRGDGTVVGKEQYLAALVSPYNTYERLDINPDDVQVMAFEETAVVSLLITAKGIRRTATGEDKEFSGVFRNTRIFLKGKMEAGRHQEEWQCVVWFNTKVREIS